MTQQEVYVREVANLSKISPASAKKYLDILYEEKLILRKKRTNLLLYRGNLENPAFRQMKIACSVYKLMKCGIVDYLISEFSPVSIVLFGSVARGEDERGNDIDLFVLAKKREVDLALFEKGLSRKVNLIVHGPKILEKKAKEDKPFYEGVTLNCIVLHGELPVV